MNQLARNSMDNDWSEAAMLDAASAVIHRDLQPMTTQIDLEGIYPERVMRNLGAAGAFYHHLPASGHVESMNLPAAVKAMSRVSEECMSTGFAVWCQDTCGWYLENAANSMVQEQWIHTVASGKTLGGTGMSNPMKAFAGIERLRLQGRRAEGGYIVNGNLPWVSNLGQGHIFGTLFALEGASHQSVMTLVDCDMPGFTLKQMAHFTALEGSGTYACIFDDVFIPDAMIIDENGAPFLHRSKAGIVLLQTGMGLGVAQSCIDISRETESFLSHVNRYLDDRPEDLQNELNEINEAVMALAETPYEYAKEYFRAVLQVRLRVSEITLRSAQSAMLHSGAKGYLRTAPAQRKLREAYFVAMITPSIKHLRKELAEMN
ncbi:acyl-CoA/acyl-ACP dehydrogenase [Acidithiobacillus ferriphilus]|nr:acyl-CoA/acyl-ACP dehydrogenase [Acidithiobacillus ferriphilus]